MTSLPIMVFALNDYQYSKDISESTENKLKKFMANPSLYKIGLNNECFSIKHFFLWVIYASF